MKQNKKIKYFTTSTRAFDFNPVSFLAEFAAKIQGYKIISGTVTREKMELDGYLIRCKLKELN